MASSVMCVVSTAPIPFLTLLYDQWTKVAKLKVDLFSYRMPHFRTLLHQLSQKSVLFKPKKQHGQFDPRELFTPCQQDRFLGPRLNCSDIFSCKRWKTQEGLGAMLAPSFTRQCKAKSKRRYSTVTVRWVVPSQAPPSFSTLHEKSGRVWETKTLLYVINFKRGRNTSVDGSVLHRKEVQQTVAISKIPLLVKQGTECARGQDQCQCLRAINGVYWVTKARDFIYQALPARFSCQHWKAGWSLGTRLGSACSKSLATTSSHSAWCHVQNLPDDDSLSVFSNITTVQTSTP